MDKILDMIAKWDPAHQLWLAATTLIVGAALLVVIGLWLLAMLRSAFESMTVLARGWPPVEPAGATSLPPVHVEATVEPTVAAEGEPRKSQPSTNGKDKNFRGQQPCA